MTIVRRHFRARLPLIVACPQVTRVACVAECGWLSGDRNKKRQSDSIAVFPITFLNFEAFRSGSARQGSRAGSRADIEKV